MSSLCLLYALSGFWGRGGTPGGVGAKPAGGDDGPWLKKLQEKLGAMVPGNTLYRLGEPGAPRCPHLDRHQHRPASDAAAALLTPPEAVPVWTPPTGEGLEAMHRARAQRLLAPWRESGLHRSNMVTADHEDHVQCEEPILIKYKAGKLYATVPTHGVDHLAGFDGSKSSFMNPRRRHTLDNVRASVERSKKAGRVVKDFEIMGCVGDGYLHTTDKVALGLAWGGEGTGTLPMSEMEWNWAGHEEWGRTLSETLANRGDKKWTERVDMIIWRGGVGDRSCFPPKATGGDEMGRTNPAFVGQSCGRPRLLEMSKCFPSLLNAMPSDHGNNWVVPAEQEAYKYVIYVEGNYGWANRLKTLLAMGNALIMQENSAGAKEWYALDLKPWVHYIPVDHLFNHIPEVMAWGQHNDGSVQQISANADAYARAILSPASFAMHLDVMLSEYSKLIRFDVELEPGVDMPADFFTEQGFHAHMKYINVLKETMHQYPDHHLPGLRERLGCWPSCKPWTL